MSFDLAGALKTLAPTLATMLGGPFAGTAVTALESALGLTAGSGADAVANLIQSGNLTPDQVAAIHAADLKHQEVMGQQQIDLLKVNLDYQQSITQEDVVDVTDARKNNVQGGTSKGLFWLSIVIIMITFGAEITVLFHGYPKDSVPDIVVGRVLGLLDAAGTMVLGYWYGSSHGSAVKTDLLQQGAQAK